MSAYRTKHQIAYDIIREAILSGELRPGQRIVVTPDQARSSQAEHRAIMAAVAARDDRAAEAAVRHHLIHAAQQMVRLMNDGLRPNVESGGPTIQAPSHGWSVG